MTLEEARRRIVEALEVVPCEGWPDDWWVSEAIRVIQAHQAIVSYRRVYDVSTVGARIRTAREVVGLTQLMFADRIGVKQRDVSRWERGQADMPAGLLVPLCLCLGVSRAWVLGDSDEGGPPLPGGILRRQKLVNWQQRSAKTQARYEARAELQRLRGLRPPKRPKKRREVAE